MTSNVIDRRSLFLTATASTLGAAGPLSAQVTTAGVPVTSPWTEQGFVIRPGMRIHFASVGSGPVVVLVHKLGGWISDWRHIAPALAKSHRVIAIDAPGHGESTVAGKPPYIVSMAESAANIIAALDELGIDQFAYVGNSMGGCIGACIAALWPDRVTRLGLLSVALYEKHARDKLDTLEPPGTWGPNDEPLSRPFEVQRERFGIVDRDVYEEQIASRAKAGPWVRPSQRGVAGGGVIDYLARAECPVLLMYGERGTNYDGFEGPGLKRAKRARSVHIPNAGSFAQQENPRATEKIILDFLAEKAG